MIWTTITAAMLEGVMTAAEAGLARKAVSVGVPDRTPAVLANLIAEIRGNIATWAPNTLSADTTTIPPSMVGNALIIARSRVLTGISGYVQDEARKAETESAKKYFELVARGTIRPEPADDAVATAVPAERNAPAPKITARTRNFTRDQQDGI